MNNSSFTNLQQCVLGSSRRFAAPPHAGFAPRIYAPHKTSLLCMYMLQVLIQAIHYVYSAILASACFRRSTIPTRYKPAVKKASERFKDPEAAR